MSEYLSLLPPALGDPYIADVFLRERAEKIAAEFHRVYESLAPQFDYDTRAESAVPWADVPAPNRALMVTTVANLLINGVVE